jgi:ParB family chromosome partitioning protein
MKKKIKNFVVKGEKIPVEKFHVSEMNVRSEEAFGVSEEDKKLINNLRHGNIIQPFIARPEGSMYGVFIGRRRFLAKKYLGAKNFVVGVDCLIQVIDGKSARESSFIENLKILRKDMNPILRARQLNDLISLGTGGIRGTARRLGVAASTLSDWLRVLELAPKVQEAILNNKIHFSDALKIKRMKLNKEQQEKLANVAEEGMDAFKKELHRIVSGKTKKGLPKGVYFVLRANFDKRSETDLANYEKLKRLAESKSMRFDECAKWIITEYLKSI